MFNKVSPVPRPPSTAAWRAIFFLICFFNCFSFFLHYLCQDLPPLLLGQPGPRVVQLPHVQEPGQWEELVIGRSWSGLILVLSSWSCEKVRAISCWPLFAIFQSSLTSLTLCPLKNNPKVRATGEFMLLTWWNPSLISLLLLTLTLLHRWGIRATPLHSLLEKVIKFFYRQMSGEKSPADTCHSCQVSWRKQGENLEPELRRESRPHL